jgi:peptidyl-prolyl cis-trans isomerase SurA
MGFPMQRSLAMFAASAVLFSGCSKKPGPDVAATVNNRPVTYSDLDKFYKRQFVVDPEGASEDLRQTRRLEVLRTLIDNEIMLQRAQKEGLMATDSEVDTKFTELRSPYTQEQFEKSLKDQGLGENDLRTQIRRELSLQKLINKDIISRITISDADLASFYNKNKASFNFPEPQIRIAQIVVTPEQDPNAHNLKNDKAQNDEQARKKITLIAERLKQGEDFASLAQNYSEDPSTAPNGGDMGPMGESALDHTSPELKKMIVAMIPGQISGVVPTPGGYRIFKMIAKEPAGQRELADPRVQQNIRNLLMNRKDTLLRSAYLEVAHSEAHVVNYYAQQILTQPAARK